MILRNAIPCIVIFVSTLLTPSSGVYAPSVLKAYFNDGGVVKGAFQGVFKGPEVWYAWELRIKKSYLESVCNDTCGNVEDKGLSWSLRSFWSLQVRSGTQAQCGVQGGVYDPTFACGPDGRFEGETCDHLRNQSLVGEYNCNADPISCMMGDLSGKFGKLASKKHGSYYLFKGKTGLDPFPPSIRNYCDGAECVDLNSIPTNNDFGSLLIHCPCGEEPLACAKLHVDTSKKHKAAETGIKGYGAQETSSKETGYGSQETSSKKTGYAANHHNKYGAQETSSKIGYAVKQDTKYGARNTASTNMGYGAQEAASKKMGYAAQQHNKYGAKETSSKTENTHDDYNTYKNQFYGTQDISSKNIGHTAKEREHTKYGTYNNHKAKNTGYNTHDDQYEYNTHDDKYAYVPPNSQQHNKYGAKETSSNTENTYDDDDKYGYVPPNFRR